MIYMIVVASHHFVDRHVAAQQDARANALWDIPVFALIADTFTDGTSARERRAVGTLPPRKVTVTFRAFFGFLWCFIAVGYFSIGTTSMTRAAGLRQVVMPTEPRHKRFGR